MLTSATLSRYIGRQFLVWFCLMLLLFLGIILMLDTVELLRRAGNKPDVTFGLVLEMALFKLPDVGQQIFPFVVLFSAMYTFWRLTRSAELVVVRAVGVSAWQFMMPVILGALLIGAVKTTIINPIGAIVLGEYEKMEDMYIKRQTSTLEVSRAGLWLRQTDDDNQYFIHSGGIASGAFELRDVSIFRFAADGTYRDRTEAPKAVLEDHHWVLIDATLYPGKGTVQKLDRVRIPTELDAAMIEESFASPNTVSFWALPRFIETLEATGFPAIRHRLFFQGLLAQPLLFCAMVLFAAAFSLRMPRRGGTFMILSGGVLTGFVVFVVSDVIRTLGLSETIPVELAAWSPAGIALMLGITALLHLEDG